MKPETKGLLMKFFDRILLLALVAGIWTLVLSPVSLQARVETNCAFTFDSASGQIADGTLVMKEIHNNGAYHSSGQTVKLKNRALTLQSATGSITCP
jgi:hypothetical protein